MNFVAIGCVLHILNLILMNAYHSTFAPEEMGVPGALRTSFVASYLVHKFPEVPPPPPPPLITHNNNKQTEKLFPQLCPEYRIYRSGRAIAQRLVARTSASLLRAPRRGAGGR